MRRRIMAIITIITTATIITMTTRMITVIPMATGTIITNTESR